ncbi:hypothetical protein BC830DRAFT_325620 [Chytriomyces sp. MP71]|nr:hypothetical protein BC830DRAFT_325620 [Chytriomyces sp. MP71]
MFSVGVLLFAASVFAAPAALPSCLEQPGPIVSIVTSFASSAGYVSSAVPTNGPATSSTYRSSSSSMASQSDSSTSVSGSSMSPVTSKAQVTSPSSSSSAGLAATTAVPTIMFLQKIGPGTIPYSGSLTDGCIYALLTPSLFENAHDQECGPQDPAARYGRYFNFTSRNLTLRIGSVNGSFAFEVGYVASARREVSNDPRSWVFLYGANAPSAVTASQTGSSQTSTATTATNVSLYVSSSASSTTLVSSSSSDVASATFSAWSSAASSPIPSTNSLSTGVSSAAITVTSGTFTSLTSSSSVGKQPTMPSMKMSDRFPFCRRFLNFLRSKTYNDCFYSHEIEHEYPANHIFHLAAFLCSSWFQNCRKLGFSCLFWIQGLDWDLPCIKMRHRRGWPVSNWQLGIFLCSRWIDQRDSQYFFNRCGHLRGILSPE